MKYFNILLTLLTVSLLSGCVTERTVIPRGHNAVYSVTDFWFFDQEGGMSNRILPPGKQEFSTGYNTVYYIPTMQQNYPLGNLSILMKERVAREFNVNFGFKVVPGADLKLVLNFLPESDAKKIAEGHKGLDIITVNLKQIFATNVLPFARQVIMDAIDNESLYKVDTESLAVIIDRQLKGMLANIKLIERTVDDNGDIVLSGNTISIVDVIDINNINIVPGGMPEIVKTAITDLNFLQADLKQAKEDLKISKDIKSEEILNAATNIKAENDALATLLEDDKFTKYQKLQQLKGIVEVKVDSDGKIIESETKTKIHFYQKGMTTDDIANMVRSSQ